MRLDTAGLLADRARVRWHELQKYDVISLGRGSGSEAILNYALTRLKLELAGTFETQHASTALGLPAAGASAAVLPSMTRRKGTYPRVRMIPLVEPLVERELAVIKRRGTTFSRHGSAVRDDLGSLSRHRQSRQCAKAVMLSPSIPLPKGDKPFTIRVFPPVSAVIPSRAWNYCGTIRSFRTAYSSSR